MLDYLRAVHQALAVRAASARGAVEGQLGIARHATEHANHVLGGCRALALPFLESGRLRRPVRAMSR